MEPHSSAKAAPTAAIVQETDDPGDSRDARDLLRLGKKPVLKRNFNFMSILGFSCTVLITWEGILIVSTQSLLNGGPAGVIWGYLIVWVGTLSTFTALSELASMAPTSGGQYHWVAMLAPSSSRRFLSYFTGWMSFAGWQAVTASSGYLIGTLVQSIIVLLKSDYEPQPWQAVLLIWAVLGFAAFINTAASKALAHFESLTLVLHILGFFAIVIPLVYLAPPWRCFPLHDLRQRRRVVYSRLVLHGADSAVHMAEEIRNASTVLPRAIIISIVLNGVLGFAILIAYLFCLGDLEAVLESQATLGYPFLFVFQKGVRSDPGAAVMGLLIVTLGICATVGVVASSSRMLWSFARDRGVPIWKTFVKLERRTSIPVYAVAFTTLVSVLLSLITLGSSVAFNNIVNLSIREGIKPYDAEVSRVGPGNLHWGPWRIPGIVGVLNNVFACAYLLLLCFWAFWPPATQSCQKP
ncbi:amino acid transporter [Apiospora arundinis]